MCVCLCCIGVVSLSCVLSCCFACCLIALGGWGWCCSFCFNAVCCFLLCVVLCCVCVSSGHCVCVFFVVGVCPFCCRCSFYVLVDNVYVFRGVVLHMSLMLVLLGFLFLYLLFRACCHARFTLVLCSCFCVVLLW